jgi:hypothetical protein
MRAPSIGIGIGVGLASRGGSSFVPPSISGNVLWLRADMGVTLPTADTTADTTGWTGVKATLAGNTITDSLDVGDEAHYASRDIPGSVVGRRGTLKVELKAGTRTWARVQWGNASPGDNFAYINLATGAVGTTGAATVSASIVDKGGGWYELTLVGPVVATTFAFIVIAEADNDVLYTGNGTGTILMRNFWAQQHSVSQWDDQSGTGDANKNVAQATAGNQPLFNASDANLGGRPSLTFSKARKDRLVSGTWTVANPSPATWFLVGSLTSRDSGGYSLAVDGIVGTNRQGLGTSNGNGLIAFSGTILTDGAFTTGKFVQCGVMGASGKIYVNAKTAAASATTGTQTLTGLSVGTDAGNTTGNVWDGQIAEVIGYNRALSQGEVETVLTYLGTRYAIAIGA